ncbi:ADOP family duplicated permease [Stenotrophomonas sp. SMYL11]|uniref:ADOP family duplicated permease n=1 Tax=Stenotrophomonas sp. SMYL11 TaxID=3076042 RepID=UPI002E77D1C2|nr:ADOP family duplicated permease [Stenotrophomonas sp. SMYL11]
MNVAALLDDVLQAWRALVRKPGFVLLATLTLALGVATVTTVFSLIDQALLRPLPFPQPERLVTIGIESEPGQTVAAPRYLNHVRQMPGVQSAGMIMGWTNNANVAFHGDAEVARALQADRGFLDALALPMAVGRNFNDAENTPGGPQGVIVSHAFWKSHLGADSAVVGKPLLVEGLAVPIVGVLSEHFQWPDTFDIIQNMQLDSATRDLSTNQLIVARLKPGVPVDTAAAQASTVLNAMMNEGAGASEKQRAYLQRNPPTALPLEGSVFAHRSGEALWMFLGAGLCVLAIAGINLASLMLLRALSRTHDSAVRTALGASSMRLGLPPVAEGALVGLLGSAAGLAMAWAGLQAFGRLVPAEWMRGQPVALTATAIVVALLAGVLTAVLAALLGVFRARRVNWSRELASGGRTGWGKSATRTSRALVVAQVAVAVVLLTGAALFARSLQKLEAVPLGFQSTQVTTFTLALIKNRYSEVDAAVAQTERILQRLGRVPGVSAIGASTNLPAGSQLNYSMQLPSGATVDSQYRLASPDFLNVFNVPLLTGRGFEESDRAGSEPVCLVSATFASRHLGGDPLGQIVTMPMEGGQDIRMRVVGVVGDVRQFGPDKPAPATVYAPLAQMPADIWALLREFGPLSYAVRMRSNDLGQAEGALRTALAEVAPQQPIANVQPMQAVVASATAAQRLNLVIIGVFAALALLLASVGLYAVMAVAVAGRSHEFGVRSALGATRRRLVTQILGESGRQVLLGMAIGLALAMAVSGMLQKHLYGVGATDPVAILLVLLALATAALLASVAPALRAAAVQPMQALRND